MSDEIGLDFDSAPVRKGVDESIRSLDKLIAQLAKFEKFTNTVKDSTSANLKGTLAATEKHNRSLLQLLNELRKQQLEALQQGNIGTVNLTAKQNKVLQGLYEARVAMAGKLANQELAEWKKLGASLGFVEKAQLAESQTAQKTAAAATLARIKQIGAASSAMLSARVAEGKTEAAATMANIKMMGAASANMMRNKIAEGKIEAAATMANIKQVGGAYSSMMRQRNIDAKIRAEKEAAEAAATLARIKDIGAAWRLMSHQAAASATGNYSSLTSGALVTNRVNTLASASRGQVQQATNNAVGQYSSLSTGKLIDPQQISATSTALRKLGGDMGYAHSAARGLASGFGLLWLTWGKLVPLFAGASVSFGVARTFSIGSEVEYLIKHMTTLGDLTKMQGSQIRAELRAIDQTTIFSLTELSQVMVTLGQAGFAAKDALLITKTSADLAAVGMTDMNVTSKLLVQTMALFPEAAKDVNKAATQIYQVTKDGVLNIEDLGGSMKQASIANIAYGQSLETTLAMLAGLAQAGIKGTAAGTSYRNMLQDLHGRTKPAAAALKELEARTGKTIETFDKFGKARSAIAVIQDINEALKAFSPEDALKLTNEIFTERGVKAFFTALREGTVDMAKYVEQLEKADPKTLFMAAQGMMDTSKGAMDILKGSLVGALDRVFEGLSDRFKKAIVQITAVIDSNEFSNMLNGMVSSVIGLYEAVVKLSPVLTALGVAFLAVKGAALLSAAMTGLAGVLAPLVGALGGTSYSLGLVAGRAVSAQLAVKSLGTSMLVTAAQARAASLGMDATAIAAAGAAVKTTAAAGAARVLAIALGFLANPIVGIIATLGVLGATWWATSRESQTASDAMTSKVYKDGKVNIDILNQEIAKLHERNAVRNQGPVSPVRELANEAFAEKKKLDSKIAAWEARNAKLTDARQKAATQVHIDRAKAERDVVLGNFATLSNAAADYESITASNAAAEESKRQKAALKAAQETQELWERQNNQPRTPINPGAAAAMNNYTASVNNNSAAITKNKDAEVAASQARYNSTTSILDAMRAADLINHGAHEAAVIEATEAHEKERIDVITRSNGELATEMSRVQAGMQAEAAMDVAKSKLKAKELAEYKLQRQQKLHEDMVSVLEKGTAEIEKSNAEIEKIESEAYTRRAKAAIAFAGEVKKARKEAEDYRKKIAEDQLADAATDTFNAQYKNVNSNSTAEMQAQKAAAEAVLATTQKHRAELLRLNKVVQETSEAYQEMLKSDNATVREQADNYRVAMFAAQKDVVEFQKETAKDVAIASARAYRNAMEREMDRLRGSISDAIMTGLIEGGDAGKKALRDLIVEELKKPVRMYIDAFVNLITGGATADNPWVKMAKSAYDAYTGGSGGAGAGGGLAAAGGAYATTGGTGYVAGTTTSYAAGTVGVEAGMVNSVGTASTASSGMAMGWMGWAAFIAAAVMIAENLYSKGYNRTAVGIQSSKVGNNNSIQSYEFGRGNYTSGANMASSWQYKYSLANGLRRFFDMLGVSEKWTDIFSGTVRMATLFGRKLKGYGYQIDVNGSDVGVKNYEYHKGGLFRSNKTLHSETNAQDAQELRDAIEGLRVSAKGMASVMGYSTEAIDNYTGSMRINLKGVTTAEEASKRMGEEMDKMYFAMLKAASGGKLTKEAFESLMADVKKTIDEAGISSQSIGATLAQGAIGRMTESEVGEALSESIIGGIYNTFANNAFAPVAEAFVGQIITPIFTAIMAGVPISQAISQAAIDNVVAMANRAADALNVIFSNAEFMAGMDRIKAGLASIAKISTSSAKYVKSYGTAVNSAAQKAKAAADEKFGLETKLLGLLNNTAKLRERELNALHASNRSLQQRIWALEDARAGLDSALEALQKAVDKEKEAIEKQLEAARELESSLNDIFKTLRDNIRELRGEVEDTAKMQYSEAIQYLQSINSSAVEFDSEKITEAIAAARSGTESGRYASRVEADRANLQLANLLESVQGFVQPKLTQAEQTIALLEQQIEALDLQLQVAEDSVNVLLGIDTSVQTVASAVLNLATAMSTYTQAVAAAAGITVSASAPTTSTTTTSSGTYTAPTKVWTVDGYWAKNPDLQTYYNTNKTWLDAQFGGVDQYLKWHWDNYGINENRRYAKGGYYPGGTALVGEYGPELINFKNPGQVYTADESRKIFDDKNQREESPVSEQLLAELRETRALNLSIALSNNRMLTILKRVTRRGTSIEVSTETPLQVTSV